MQADDRRRELGPMFAAVQRAALEGRMITLAELSRAMADPPQDMLRLLENSNFAPPAGGWQVSRG